MPGHRTLPLATPTQQPPLHREYESSTPSSCAALPFAWLAPLAGEVNIRQINPYNPIAIVVAIPNPPSLPRRTMSAGSDAHC